MPDIKTALQIALEKAKPIPADWDDEGGAAKIEEVSTTNQKEQPMDTQNKQSYFQTTNNVTRETFNYVLKNPGCLRRTIMRDLEQRGFKSSSISSLVTQMIKNKLIKGDPNTGLFATYHEYRPLRTFSRSRAEVKAKRKYTRKAKPEALVQTPAQTPAMPTPETPWSAQKLLEGLSVLQARALYDELKKIFGG